MPSSAAAITLGASSWPSRVVVAQSRARRVCDADAGSEDARTRREARGSRDAMSASVVCGAGSCCGWRAWAGEAQQCHKGVTAMWPWSCFWVGLLTWEGETGRTPPISTLVWRANSVAHTNVEIGRNLSPEFHQLDEIWRNSGCLLERHCRLKSAMKRGGEVSNGHFRVKSRLPQTPNCTLKVGVKLTHSRRGDWGD